MQTRQEADKLLIKYQVEGLQKGQGDLYKGVAETLQVLHAKEFVYLLQAMDSKIM